MWEAKLMAYLHCTGAGVGTRTGSGIEDYDYWVEIYYSEMSYWSETGTRTGPIVSYCASHVPCICSGPGPVQCE